MSVQIKKISLENSFYKVPGFAFLPKDPIDSKAIFTHGYTASMESLLNWGQRCAQLSIPTIVFNLPGHLIGSDVSVSSMEEFIQYAPSLFHDAAKYLDQLTQKSFQRVFYGGHSLGALLSLMANENNHQSIHILVGFGDSLQNENKTHILETDFFQQTLNYRGQLVDPAIAPNILFPWLRDKKLNIKVSNKKIFLLIGKNDIISPPKDVEKLKLRLEEMGNEITYKLVPNLPHHLPEMAAPHIGSFVKGFIDLNNA